MHIRSFLLTDTDKAQNIEYTQMQGYCVLFFSTVLSTKVFQQVYLHYL